MGKLEDANKEKVRDAAAIAVVLDTFPFTFSKNPGMISFLKAILGVGQSLPLDVEFNVEELLSSNVSIKNTIKLMAKTYREEFSIFSNDVCDIGGALSTDGLPLSVTGDKYYDFNLHFFNIKNTSFATAPSAKLQTRLLFIKRHNGPSTAAALRELFDGCVKKNTGKSLDDFTKKNEVGNQLCKQYGFYC